MDKSVAELIAENSHHKILELVGDSYNPIKAIAAINIGEYEKAYKLATKNSFEAAYALYKLRRYKRALRILRKLDGTASEMLKSQCLYFLGYYSEAHQILSKISTKDEFAVNLAAMESLSYLNEKNKERVSLFASEYRGSINKSVTPKFSSKMCQAEYKFNLLFEKIENEREYISELNSLNEQMDIPGGCIEKQLKNLHSELITDLGVREREIYEFNTGKSKEIKDPVHFQKNFIEGCRSEYGVISKCMGSGSDVEINCTSDKMRYLKVFKLLKEGVVRKKTSENILSRCDESLIKDALLLMTSKCRKSEFQAKAIELILQFKSL